MILFTLGFRVYLNESNITEYLNKHTDIPHLGMFFSPWCHHCQEQHPKFLKVSEYFENDTKIGFYDFNCEKYHEKCSEFSVNAYPTYITTYNGTKVPDHMKNDIDYLFNHGFTIYEKYVFNPLIEYQNEGIRKIPSFLFNYPPYSYNLLNKVRFAIRNLDVSKYNFYINRTKPENISFQTDFDNIIYLTENYTVDSIRNFVESNNFTEFNITLEKIKKLGPKILIYISTSTDYTEFNKYYPLLSPQCRMFHSSAFGTDQVLKLFNLAEGKLPAAVLYESESNKSTILENVDGFLSIADKFGFYIPKQTPSPSLSLNRTPKQTISPSMTPNSPDINTNNYHINYGIYIIAALVFYFAFVHSKKIRALIRMYFKKLMYLCSKETLPYNR
ncbi:hypothetical protein TVAG_233660 [Trichomonas vaginalis G3]|uniref:Thioredoxin domain-containing protein n=1 Tax=Trichomonas vaginalis (strain ATCC PRA-98 / G3) TaxID=412133 RepID=A2FLU6_TRIV3|nr:cell redox homeostasis [Trichomonas vaginalis G3]EAX94115.1 hypothetical protein TVAG_233660 [Trichomonas vaginalis G3]KAI5512691.1 cell redox homeostasis [Trichomonas vaginalis G3]|eukprot:XP_001307045.1 hypothetical protein [Trichomonas vaginalis G3]